MENIEITWDHHLKNSNHMFLMLLHENSLVDVTLSCKDGSLKAHRIVLSASSPYFQKILSEHHTKHPIIILRGVSYRDLEKLVNFMYKGTVSCLRTEFNNLEQLAKDLEIKGFFINKEEDTKNWLQNSSCLGKKRAVDGICPIPKKKFSLSLADELNPAYCPVKAVPNFVISGKCINICSRDDCIFLYIIYRVSQLSVIIEKYMILHSVFN